MQWLLPICKIFSLNNTLLKLPILISHITHLAQAQPSFTSIWTVLVQFLYPFLCLSMHWNDVSLLYTFSHFIFDYFFINLLYLSFVSTWSYSPVLGCGLLWQNDITMWGQWGISHPISCQHLRGCHIKYKHVDMKCPSCVTDEFSFSFYLFRSSVTRHVCFLLQDWRGQKEDQSLYTVLSNNVWSVQLLDGFESLLHSWCHIWTSAWCHLWPHWVSLHQLTSILPLQRQ